MAAKEEWHYAKDGQQIGPISAADLKRLASTGELSATDLVWKDGMADWKKAASIKGLFPTEQSATTSPPPIPNPANDSPDSNGKSPKANVAEAVKSDLNDIVGAAKKAKDLTVAHARKTQISQISLPNAYFSLGKDVLANERFRDEFSDLFDKIAATNDEISKVKTSAEERPPATDLKGKVKSGAVQLVAKGQTTKLGFQRDSLIRDLGKRAFESHGDSAGPQELVSPIQNAIEELSRLDSQIKSLPSSKQIPIWQRVPIAALLTVCCFPVGLALVWFNPRLSRSSKALWIGGFAVFFICMMVISGVAVQHAREELATAHQLWSSGDRQAAISKYRVLLKEDLHALPESDRSLVFGRVIDFDADAGNDNSVEELLKKAAEEHIVPSFSSEKARLLNAERIAEQKIAASLAQPEKPPTEMPRTDLPPTNARQSSSKSPLTVSKGWGNGSFILELGPEVQDEIEVSEAKLDHSTIICTLYWKGSVRGRKNPWSYAAYDKDGTQIDGATIALPGTISLGSKIKVQFTLQSSQTVKEFKKIVIHR